MLKHTKHTLILAATLLGTSSASFADGLYVSAMLGGSEQVNDSEAYGSNIAVDPDFPRGFDSGDGSAGSLGLGYAYNKQLAFELRLGYHNSDFNSREVGTGAREGEEYILNGDIKSTTLTLEALYDIPVPATIQPYLKAGVGVSRNKYSARLGGAGVAGFDAFDGTEDGYYDAYASQTSTEFSWTVGFGASYPLNDSLALVGEYQLISLGDADTKQDGFTDGFEIESAAQEVMIGIRATF